MKSKVDPAFWRRFNALPSQVQQLARDSFALWLGRENVMSPPEADRLGERAGSFCLVGLKRGRPRMMRSVTARYTANKVSHSLRLPVRWSFPSRLQCHDYGIPR
jgi:hypothetical protein